MPRRLLERPPWCGQCDELSRLVERADGIAARCPRCHAACQPGGRHAPRIAGPGSIALDAQLGHR